MKKSNKKILGIFFAVIILILILKYLAIPLGIAGLIYIIYKYIKTKDKKILIWAIAPVSLLLIGGTLNNNSSTTATSSPQTSENLQQNSSSIVKSSSKESTTSSSISVKESSEISISDTPQKTTTEELSKPDIIESSEDSSVAPAITATEENPEATVESTASTEDRTVYVASHGNSKAYWYSISNMPSSTKIENVVTMTETEALNSGKHHSMKE